MKKQLTNWSLRVKKWLSVHPWGWFVLGVVVLVWVVVRNSFPLGFTFAGPDATQILNVRESFQQLLYEHNGWGSVFYGCISILEWLGIQGGTQLSFLFLVFLFGSYISFWLFLKWVVPHLRLSLRWLSALVYSLNLYTLHLALLGDVFSPRVFLYIFLPLATGAYLSFLKKPSVVMGAWFVAGFFAASLGFVSAEVVVAFVLFLALLKVGAFLSGWAKWSRDKAIQSLELVIAALFVSAWWLPSFWYAIRESSGAPAYTDFVDHSVSIFDNLRFMQLGGLDLFPSAFPYASIAFAQPLFMFFASLPVVLVAWALYMQHEEKDKGLLWVLAGTLAVFVVLSSNALLPFGSMNSLFFFRVPFFDRLMGEGSLLVFVPFLLASLIALALLKGQDRALQRVRVGLVVLVLMTPLPFFFGKIHKTVSPMFLDDNRDDSYQKAVHSPLVDIPHEYFQLASRINSDSGDVKIASLPSTASEPEDIGREDYPVWKVRAADPIASLFNKQLLSSNEYYYNQWLAARDFNLWKDDPTWFVKLLGFSNVKYVLYHKDAPMESFRESSEKVAFLEQGHWLVPIEENSYFKLYRVRDDMVMPRVWWARQNVVVNERPESIQNVFEAIRTDAKEAMFSRENEGRLQVKASQGGKDTRMLVLDEPYRASWQAIAVASDGKRYPLEHVKAFGLLNGWKVPSNIKGDIVIEYAPTKWLVKGLAISLVTFAVAVIIIISTYVYGKRKNIV